MESPLQSQHPSVVEAVSYAWIETLIVNVSGYASVIIPVYLVVQYLKRSNYLQRHGMHSMTPVCLVLLPCEFAIK